MIFFLTGDVGINFTLGGGTCRNCHWHAPPPQENLKPSEFVSGVTLGKIARVVQPAINLSPTPF